MRSDDPVAHLRQALSDDAFELYCQPIAALGGLVKAYPMGEILIRLREEEQAMLPPGEFLPVLEHYGLMPQLDRWVLREALRRLAVGSRIARLSLNLSAQTLADPGVPGFIAEQLAASCVPGNCVLFEVEEHDAMAVPDCVARFAAVGNMARVVHFIQRLRARGCRFALDDFGVGMSSFGYLKNLPVDYIKIDGSFIREIETDAMSYSIVRAVTDIGHQVGVEVVAEFVGNERTIELLRGLGVDYAQGYAVHVPVPTGV